MSDNPLELIVFFDSVDCLFRDLEVLQALQVTLLKSYLSEKAVMLVSRLTGAEAADCKKILDGAIQIVSTVLSRVFQPNIAQF